MKRFLAAVALLSLAAVAQDIKLPAPRTTGGKPLMEALNERKTTREFSPEKLSPQALSNLLWAAWGINRADGRHTAPSASNRQEIDVYVLMADGAYLYDAKTNTLKGVVAGDLRKQTGAQPFVAEAALNLVYVADMGKMGGNDEARYATASADTGFIAQNVYLFCASEGLGAVVRGSVDRTAVAKALSLRADQRITLGQTVGHIKK
jgi:SagB-type dehydrogenase family enzyme